MKLGRTKPVSRRNNHFIGIRATKPLEILHADATLFTMKDNAKEYIYLVQDNFSRAILSFRAALECKSKYAFENIKYVHSHFIASSGIEHCSLVTDNGSENHGDAASFANACRIPEITHLIAQKTILQSNSMIETANKHIKYHFLYHKEIANFEQFKKYLHQAIEDYNNRPHDVLTRLTPT